MLKFQVLCNGFKHVHVTYFITVDLDTTGMHRQTQSHTESLAEKETQFLSADCDK